MPYGDSRPDPGVATRQVGDMMTSEGWVTAEEQADREVPEFWRTDPQRHASAWTIRDSGKPTT